MTRPIIGSGLNQRSRIPRTLHEAFGWDAPLEVERKRARFDADYWVGAIVAGFLAGLAALVVLK